MEIVSKITTKTFGKITFDDISKLKDGESTKLMIIMGKVTSFKVGSTPLGPYISFSGRFKAENVNDGRIFYSGAMILPKTAQDLLYGQIESVEHGVGVEFAFAIGYRRDDASAVKYVFTFEPLLDMAVDDPLAALDNKVRARQEHALALSHAATLAIIQGATPQNVTGEPTETPPFKPLVMPNMHSPLTKVDSSNENKQVA